MTANRRPSGHSRARAQPWGGLCRAGRADVSNWCVLAGTIIALAIALSGCSWPFTRSTKTPPDPQEQVHISPVVTSIPGDRVKIPCHLRENLPFVEGYINGNGPYTLAIDSGSTGLLIDRNLAARLRLRRLRTVADFRDRSGRRDCPIARVRSVQMGPCEFNKVDATVLDFADPEDLSSGGFDAVMGIGVFRDCILTIDYPAEKVIVSRGDAAPKLTVTDADTLEFQQTSTCLMLVPISIGASCFPVMVDTGLSDGLCGPIGLESRLSFESERVRLPWRSAYLLGGLDCCGARAKGNLILAAHAIPAPLVKLHIGGIERSASIGGEILRHFTVTIDQQSRLIRFERSPDQPIQRMAPWRHYGFHYSLEPEGFRVKDSIRGVSLSELGLKRGDLITEVNGTPVPELEPWEWWRIRQDPIITLMVRREEETFAVDIPTTVLVP